MEIRLDWFSSSRIISSSSSQLHVDGRLAGRRANLTSWKLDTRRLSCARNYCPIFWLMEFFHRSIQSKLEDCCLLDSAGLPLLVVTSLLGQLNRLPPIDRARPRLSASSSSNASARVDIGQWKWLCNVCDPIPIARHVKHLLLFLYSFFWPISSAVCCRTLAHLDGSLRIASHQVETRRGSHTNHESSTNSLRHLTTAHFCKLTQCNHNERDE